MAHANYHNKETRLEIGATLTKAKKLQTDRSYRDKQGCYYVEGIRNFVRVIDAKLDISTIIYSDKLLTVPIARKLVRNARRNGIPTVSLTPEQFRLISHTERASGVAAIVRQHWSKLTDISPDSGLGWLVLDLVRSAGNFGTLIRTSEALGGAGFIFVSKKIDPFDPDVLRASMGSFAQQKFVRTNFSDLHLWMNFHNARGIGATPEGSIDLHQWDYTRSHLFFLGEERQGLTENQRNSCQHLVRIPMVGTADSLNLAVAGSLLLYEVYRSKTLNTL
jgi:RNA methyltransferase, TrmH family